MWGKVQERRLHFEERGRRKVGEEEDGDEYPNRPVGREISRVSFARKRSVQQVRKGRAIRGKLEDGTRRKMRVAETNREKRKKREGKDRKNDAVINKEKVIGWLAHPCASRERSWMVVKEFR
jgi:hypothetical protein